MVAVFSDADPVQRGVRRLARTFVWAVLLATVCAQAAGAEQVLSTVSGTVTMPDGTAVAGRVRAVDPYKGYAVVSTCRAEPSGRYSLNLPSGSYKLRADSGMFLSDPFATEVTVNGDGTVLGPTDLRLARGCLVHGSVVDENRGALVDGARVLVRYEGETRTDENGSFSILLRRGTHTISMLKDGYYSPIMHLSTGEQDTTVVLLKTKAGGTVQGVVTDADGQPLSGARVGVHLRWFDFQSVTTDGSGGYLLSGLDRDAQTEISASKDGYGYESGSSAVFPADQTQAILNFTLKKEVVRNVSGHVTRHDGSPVSGAKVSFGSTDCEAGYMSTLTDEKGSYCLQGVGARASIISAEAEGLAPGFKYITADEQSADLVLSPGHYAEGRVVDDDGKPVSGIGIGISVETDEMSKLGFYESPSLYRWVTPKAYSDKDGRFRLANLPAGRVFIETGVNPGYTVVDPYPIQVDRSDHVVTLSRPAQVSGTVVSGVDGKPIQRFRLSFDFHSDTRDFYSQDGTFTLSTAWVQKGRPITLTASADGYLPCQMNGVQMRGASQIDYRQVVFRLQPAVPVTGSVTDAAGKPLGGVSVTLLAPGIGRSALRWEQVPEQWQPTTSRTDAQGRFQIDKIPGARGSVMLQKQGFERLLVRNVDLLKPLRLRLLRGATLVIPRAAGLGSSDDTTVRVTHLESRVDYLPTIAKRDMLVSDIPPGVYRLDIGTTERLVRVLHVTLAPGEEHRVDLNKSGKVVLQGRVVLEGRPVCGARIAINSPSDGDLLAVGSTDSSGMYKVSTDDPGEYLCTWSYGDFQSPDRAEVEKAVALKLGISRIDVQLPDCGISGTVIDASGRPVPKADVRAYRWETLFQMDPRRTWLRQGIGERWCAERSVTADDQGRFRVAHLTPGRWMVALAMGDRLQTTIPGPDFVLADGLMKSGVAVRVPALGSACVRVVDPVTGRLVENASACCIDSRGMIRYPDLDTNSSGSAPGKDGLMFSQLPPGRYRVAGLPSTQSRYVQAWSALEVRAGRRSSAVVRLKPGGRIAFKLDESSLAAFQDRPWVGFRIRDKRTGNPVIETPQGPELGRVVHFGGGVWSECINVKPGLYTLDAVLKQGDRGWTVSSKDHLWSGRCTIEVTAGKDTIVPVSPKLTARVGR